MAHYGPSLPPMWFLPTCKSLFSVPQTFFAVGIIFWPWQGLTSYPTRNFKCFLVLVKKNIWFLPIMEKWPWFGPPVCFLLTFFKVNFKAQKPQNLHPEPSTFNLKPWTPNPKTWNFEHKSPLWVWIEFLRWMSPTHGRRRCTEKRRQPQSQRKVLVPAPFWSRTPSFFRPGSRSSRGHFSQRDKFQVTENLFFTRVKNNFGLNKPKKLTFFGRGVTEMREEGRYKRKKAPLFQPSSGKRNFKRQLS